MIGMTLYVFLLALLPVAVAFVVCEAQRTHWGLLHIYLAMLALSYGAYTVADIFTTGVADVDPLGVAALMVSISAMMVLLTFFYSRLPANIRYRVSLTYLIARVASAPFQVLLAVWALVIFWRAFVYLRYGLIANADTDSLALVGVNIPLWVGPVNQLFIAFAFTTFMWLIATFSKTGDRRRFVLRLIMLAVIIFFLSLQGRRVFLNMLVVGTMTFVSARQTTARFFSFGNIIRGIFLIAVVGIFSNFYQTIRTVYLVDTALVSDAAPTIDLDLVDAALDFQRTTDNLQVRVALWRFHYWIMEAQLDDLSNVMGGEILWSSITSVVPRVFYPDKIVEGDDVKACRFYAKECPGAGNSAVDYAQTLPSGLQADFGLLFILLVPLCILAVLIAVAYYGIAWQGSLLGTPLFILVFGAATEYLVNIEQNVGNLFSLGRDILMITLCVGAVEFLLRPMRVPPPAEAVPRKSPR